MDSTLAISTPAATVEALYRADADRLWRAVFAFCADPDIASDSVAEAYAQLMRRGESVRDAQAWTWRTAFVLARGALKSRSQAPLAPDGSAILFSRCDGGFACETRLISPDGSDDRPLVPAFGSQVIQVMLQPTSLSKP